MFTPCQLRINRQRLGPTARERVVEGPSPVFSWAMESDTPACGQAAYRLEIFSGTERLYDTGRVESGTPEHTCAAALPAGPMLTARLTLWDGAGRESAPLVGSFCRGDIAFDAPWIAASRDVPERAVYFRKVFTLAAAPVYATLYVCGLGYHAVALNGLPADDSRLDPAHTDYTRRLNYAVLPGVEELLLPGENRLDITLAEGWRRNEGKYLDVVTEKPAFFGRPQLSAILEMTLADGTRQRIATGSDWRWLHGPIVATNLFNGETYDARETVLEWGRAEPAETVPAPGGKAEPMLIPPVREKRVFAPVALSQPKPGLYVADFGQNIAGVVRLRLPELAAGQRITLRHMELLDEDGTLYTPNLRGALQQDTYIAAGDGRDLAVFQPTFTYHGFRYVSVEGFCPRERDLEAVQLYTDLDKDTRFTCGSALIDRFHRNAVMTERDNMHSILTDCPQRDERMGWMNDATVRFEETPFNFDTGAMFRKIVRDLTMTQQPDGAISCTCPLVYGSRPADPVCSSYLMAAWQNWLHNGDKETIAENFAGFAAWEDCLLAHSEGYIVNYSYYGDWAAPSYACAAEENATSAVTPGLFMSTGYSYLNARLLARFAAILGNGQEAKYTELAEKIRAAMLEKWYCPETAVMATGSQACQAFALWLGILPEADCARAAKLMRDDLVARDYHFTTGNLCTRYLLDMLTKYGYADEAYTLMTREEYPSFGFEIQQEATTVWERFELKKNPGMNSHNHPMYGAADAWCFTGLAGVTPLEAGFARCRIAPAFPKKLMSCQAALDTVRGRLHIRWVRRYGGLHLYIDLPPMTEAEVVFAGETRLLGPGSHHLARPEED